MQDLNDMVFFAEVADRGGFAAAGRTLGVPKSKLSRRISELEARLGVRLLQRTTRKLSLTVAGELYHRHCIAVREEAEAAHEALAQVQSEPRGTVRVTCPPTLARTTLAPILPRFLKAHPYVRLEVQVTDRAVNLVDEAVDVALRVRSSPEDSGTLVVKNLGTTHLLLVASPHLFETSSRPQSPQELQALPTIATSAADGRATWSLVGPRGETFELHHKPVYTANDLQMLKIAAVEGTGLAVLPAYLCKDELLRNVLVPVLPGWAPPEVNVHAVFPSRRGMVPAVRRFLDFLGDSVVGERLVEA